MDIWGGVYAWKRTNIGKNTYEKKHLEKNKLRREHI